MAKAGQNSNPLTAKTRPEPVGDAAEALRIVDLFAGCGGLTLGAEMAAKALGRNLNIRLAVDFEEAATTVYKTNFPSTNDLRTSDVGDVFATHDEAVLTAAETELATQVGTVDVLMGGPPCQGHSNLNNHTRRNDPKNALYLYMVRAANVFNPSVVLIENVPAVQHDSFNGANVVNTGRAALEDLGYVVDDDVVSLVDLGVAQKRKRHIMLATKPPLPTPTAVFEGIAHEPCTRRDLRWAIGDLNKPDGTGFDTPPKASPNNQRRMQYLIDKNIHDLPNSQRPACHQGKHSYTSMYGRLKWDEPAQTITSGFGSIGQGRYMHPEQKRALTPHEAARLQGFPDYFTFTDILKRANLATMIGNAVPPQLSERILSALFVPTSDTLFPS